MPLNLQSSLIQIVADFTLQKSQGGKFQPATLADYLGGLANGIQASLTVGSGAGQINNLFVASPSIASGTPQLYKLVTAGGLIQADGITVCNFADITFAAFLNNGAGNVVIGGGTNALGGWLGATGTDTILSGEVRIIGPVPGITGHSLLGGAGTSDTLQIVSSSGTNQLDLIIAGH